MRLIESNNLKVHFDCPAGYVKAVDGVSFHISEGERLVFIGESGSGKTVLGMTMMRLLPNNVFYSGDLLYRGKSLIKASEKEMQRIRGKDIAIIMQNPLSALNPCQSIREHLVQVLITHRHLSKKEAGVEAGRILVRTGIPENLLDYYAHQLSGGLRQRAMIALGIACDPEVLIADEPTKGLDVTIQMQIVHLIKQITDKTNKAMLIITHDLGVAAALADRIAIMYCGRIIEIGTTQDIIESPRHPYTAGLINAHPSKGLHPIVGFGPSLIDIPKGCVFCPRCPQADERCKSVEPSDVTLSETHVVRCCHVANE